MAARTLKLVRRRVSWGDLTPLDRRKFFALISEPEGDGCRAWYGSMVSGSPEWSRVVAADAEVLYNQARRLLIESAGRDLGSLDHVFVTCENWGCIALDHLQVQARNDQRITDEEKRQALARATFTPSCSDHPDAKFRPAFRRGTEGVRAVFQCNSCSRARKQRRNEAGRAFKSASGGA